MEESVPAVMVLCEEIMYLAPLTTEDDKLLGLSLGMARAASAAAEHTLQRALAVEADNTLLRHRVHNCVARRVPVQNRVISGFKRN